MSHFLSNTHKNSVNKHEGKEVIVHLIVIWIFFFLSFMI